MARLFRPCSVISATMLCVLFIFQSSVHAVEPVKAKLAKTAAWTGEPVPLMITLYSPGPFSGTASFDLPELSLTAIVRGGSPVVGSEKIDGETYFTQLHELTIYTQRSGEIVIPAFRVRFSGKQTFTSPAEPMEGFTESLTFESKRPPETEELGVVVAATLMETTQVWSPDAVASLTAGDVLQRTIVRRATGTTAMMMPPISNDVAEGVRVYVSDPVVEDRSERGTAMAERSDTIKYQFERAGTFSLPDITVVWWDVEASELQREVVPGKTIGVAGGEAASAAEEEAESGSSAWWTIFVTIACVIFVGAIAWALRQRRRIQQNNAEYQAARQLLAACRDDDAGAAYAAFVRWKQTVLADGQGQRLQELMSGSCANLGHEVERLSLRLYGKQRISEAWSGRQFTSALAVTRRLLSQKNHEVLNRPALPPLNPGPL